MPETILGVFCLYITYNSLYNSTRYLPITLSILQIGKSRFKEIK